MIKANRPRTNLRSGLDRDVYQIVKKLEEERSQNPPKNGKKRAKLNVEGVYETIKKSNSSLSRQKRKPLEDAIERVLDFHKQECSDSEDSEAALEAEVNKSNKPEDRFLLNRQMTKHWNTPSKNDNSAVSTAQGVDGKSTKKRRLSPEPDAANGHGHGHGPGNDTVSDGSAMNGTRTSRASGGGQTSAEPQSAAASKKAQKPSKYGAEQVAHGSIILGGAWTTLDEIDRDIFARVQQPDDYPRFADQPVGFLVSGPPGTGKKSVVRALAAITSTPVVPLGRYLKETRSPEKAGKIITDVFDEAKRCAPSVILIEHLHQYMAKSGAAQPNDFDHEVVSQLELGMERLREWEQGNNKPVVVVATTSKLELIDPTLRRPDFFAQTINVKVPDTDSREDIFRVLTRDLELPPEFDFKSLAVRTHGFVGDDIRAVVQMADRRARRRLIDIERAQARRALLPLDGHVDREHEHEPVSRIDPIATPARTTWDRGAADLRLRYDYITHHSYTNPSQLHLTPQDFSAAIAEHTPYMRREGFSTIPSTTWSEVGALHSVRAAFQVSIVRRIREPLLFAKFGKQRPAGVLLFGPPGCGKTLVAKAVANDAQASFILIKGPELLNKYVGESERAIRELFTRAKSCAPCILFFDEMDSLVPKRENTTTEAGARVVNALLAELDGAGDRGEVYVIGTSNRPDMIDPAVLRPGRLDKLLFVDLPTEDERVDILRTIYSNGIGDTSSEKTTTGHESGGHDTEMKDQEGVSVVEETNSNTKADGEAAEDISEDVIESVARDPRCRGFSGADLYGLYKNALDECVLRYEGGDPSLSRDDWEAALNKTKPSVPNPETYRKLAAKLHHQT